MLFKISAEAVVPLFINVTMTRTRCHVVRHIQRHADRGDVFCIWLQSGITSREGAGKCAEAGITYIDDTCIYVVRQYLR